MASGSSDAGRRVVASTSGSCAVADRPARGVVAARAPSARRRDARPGRRPRRSRSMARSTPGRGDAADRVLAGAAAEDDGHAWSAAPGVGARLGRRAPGRCVPSRARRGCATCRTRRARPRSRGVRACPRPGPARVRRAAADGPAPATAGRPPAGRRRPAGPRGPGAPVNPPVVLTSTYVTPRPPARRRPASTGASPTRRGRRWRRRSARWRAAARSLLPRGWPR